MGTSMGRSASVADGRGWIAPALLVSLTAIFITVTSATSETVLKRAVLGTIVESTGVQIATEPGTWTPGGKGTPVVEDSELRTAAGGTTLVALGKHGVIGVRERSHLSIGKTGLDGLPLSIDGEGSLSFRLPPTTDLSILTDAAIVKGPPAAEVPSGHTSAQGIITQRGRLTTVSVVRGKLRVRNRGAEEFVWVGRGEEATIATAEETPRIARMTEASENDVRRRLGVLGWLGTKTGLVAGGAAAAAVVGGVGAAAATGAFDSSSGGAGETVTAQGSPFKP